VLRGILRPYVPRTADVLHVGCGNRRARTSLIRTFAQHTATHDGLTLLLCRSPFAEDLVVDGHTGRIANIDISPVVIDNMLAKYGADGRGSNALPNTVSWQVADVTALDALESDSFDAAIDKGTMDALMVRARAPGLKRAVSVVWF
jgi:hypothetical protein